MSDWSDWIAGAREQWPSMSWDGEAFRESARARALSRDLPLPVGIDLVLAFSASRRDPAALSVLEQHVFAPVFVWLRSRGESTTTSEDVLQVVRMDLTLREPPAILGFEGRSRLYTWVRSIVARRMLKVKPQGAYAQLDDALVDAISQSVDIVEMKDTVSKLRRSLSLALDNLSAEQKRILRYHLIEKLSLADVATLLGMHRATIARRLSEIRAQTQTAAKEHARHELGTDTVAFNGLMVELESALSLSFDRLLASA